jgi:Zn-dependent peptidase ImmA (M78 family)
VPFEATFLRGLIERYANKVIIYVRKNQDEDWKRFVTIKELCHIVIDEKEDWSASGASIIKNLISEHKLNKMTAAPRAVQSEIFAEIAAIELLYPFNARAADIVALDYGSMTLARIAGYYKIPEAIVERALSENYAELAAYCWSLI